MCCLFCCCVYSCCTLAYCCYPAVAQMQIHFSSFAAGSPCREACDRLFAGDSWLVSLIFFCRICCCSSNMYGCMYLLTCIRCGSFRLFGFLFVVLGVQTRAAVLGGVRPFRDCGALARRRGGEEKSLGAGVKHLTLCWWR